MQEPELARTVAATPPPPTGGSDAAPPSADTVAGRPAVDVAQGRSGATPPAAIAGYAVVRELGRGGMGAVFEVRAPGHPDRALALKVILDRSDPTALARFGREAEVMARVRHPGVVAVHHLGQSAQGPFIVTDLVAGEPLERLAAGLVDPRRAAQVVRDLADALVAVHAAGVVHRDVKPQNVILRALDGRPVLLDFGIARDRAGERLTQTGVALGSPAYMAPEQASGRSPDTIDGRADVYAAGAILFELLAGRPPHAGASLAEVLKKVFTEEPVWPSRDRPDTPRDLEAICRMAMARDRIFRYESAAALRDDLDRWLAGERPRALDAFGAAAGGRSRAALLALAGVVVGALALAAVVVARRADADADARAADARAALDSRAAADARSAQDAARVTSGAAAPAGTTWAERVEAAARGPWPARGHVGLRHVDHREGELAHPVRACFTDDGRVVTCGVNLAGTAWTFRVWTLPGEGDEPAPPPAIDLPPGSSGYALAPLPGGRVLAVSIEAGLCELTRDGRVVRWPAPAQLEPGVEQLARALATDGEHAIVGLVAEEGGGHRSRVLRLGPDGAAVELASLPHAVNDLTRRGRLLAALSVRDGATDGTGTLGAIDLGLGALVVCDLDARRELRRDEQLRPAPTVVALLSDDARLAIGHRGGFLDLHDGDQREKLESPDARASVHGAFMDETAPTAHSTQLTGVVLAPDGTLWTTAGCGQHTERMALRDGELRAWRGSAPVPALTRTHLPGVTSLALSPDGRALLLGSDEGVATLWILPRAP